MPTAAACWSFSSTLFIYTASRICDNRQHTRLVVFGQYRLLIPYKRVGLEQRLELLFYYCLLGCAHEAVYQFATLEEEDGRYIAHAIVGSDVIVFLDVTLTHHKTAVVLFGQLRYNGSQRAARSALCSPQIHYQWQFAIQIVLKILVSDCYFHLDYYKFFCKDSANRAQYKINHIYFYCRGAAYLHGYAVK